MFFSDLESGSSIFVDANIFVYHFSKRSRFNPASTNFLECVEKRDFIGVTSTLVVQEATHRMMIMEAAGILANIKAKDYVKYRKANPDISKRLENHRVIPEKIAFFNLEIISPDITTIVRSQQMKRRYGVLSNDALSLQIMEDLKINNLASNDSDFERVDFIKLYKPSVSTESPG
ncbi:MAG: type II toxin-antitoxin system VapC family toxin [Desulfobacterales bacterium]|nr:type II toxin-antitoxin system VapC family toxin [Desulfobacterales bacterium]